MTTPAKSSVVGLQRKKFHSGLLYQLVKAVGSFIGTCIGTTVGDFIGTCIAVRSFIGTCIGVSSVYSHKFWQLT